MNINEYSNNQSNSNTQSTPRSSTHMYYDTLQLTRLQRKQVADDLVKAGLLTKATKTNMTGPHYALPEDYGTEDYVEKYFECLGWLPCDYLLSDDCVEDEEDEKFQEEHRRCLGWSEEKKVEVIIIAQGRNYKEWGRL